jgi:hypothetical protein
MQYAFLIYGDQQIGMNMSPEEQGNLMEAYNKFTEMVTSRGAMKGGEALHPTTTATTVRVRDGKTLTTDGPFAETKEQLGGFYLLECKDLDEALSFAAQIPSALTGSVEVRPVVDFSQM